MSDQRGLGVRFRFPTVHRRELLALQRRSPAPSWAVLSCSAQAQLVTVGREVSEESAKEATEKHPTDPWGSQPLAQVGTGMAAPPGLPCSWKSCTLLPPAGSSPLERRMASFHGR